jgi:hypothetical protein
MIDLFLVLAAIGLACFLTRVKITVCIRQQAVEKVIYPPRYRPQSDPISDWLFSGPSTNLGRRPVATHQNLSLKRPARTDMQLSGTTLTMPRLTDKTRLNEAVKRSHPDQGGNVDAFMDALKRRRNNR